MQGILSRDPYLGRETVASFKGNCRNISGNKKDYDLELSESLKGYPVRGGKEHPEKAQ